jgi:CheY-like chemotaxis protein
MAMMKFANKDKHIDGFHSTCKVLIVDDEQEVHSVTKTVLNQFVFEGKNLELLSAYSGEEAISMLTEHDDIQLVLLDVVMESDDAGLIVAKRIREELKQRKVRIVLRTGQPGSAPEQEVIDNYDINDYKEKTELTSKKLYTTVISSLRAYRDMDIIDHNRKALEKIVEASKTIFKLKSFYSFVEGALSQVTSLLNIDGHIFETEVNNGFFATLNDDEFKLIASIGLFKGRKDSKILTAEALALLNKAYQTKNSFFEDDAYIAYFEATNGKILFLYIEGCSRLNDIDKNFLEVFSNNIAIAFNNTCINAELLETKKELVEKIGEILIQRRVFEEDILREEISELLEKHSENKDINEYFLNYYDGIKA